MQGYDYWKKYETDYFYGNKDAYNKEKLRLADLLIDKIEKMFLPGLRKAIEVKEVATPLTNLRFTSNPRGAIYGWDQTLDNSGQRRFPQKTPVRNLYLSGAWTFPGHGYGACVPAACLFRPGHGGLEELIAGGPRPQPARRPLDRLFCQGWPPRRT